MPICPESEVPVMPRTALAIVTGRVQGVGFRAWVERQASSRGLEGWVRNRRDGAVEALFSGSPDRVAAMLEACRAGPALSRVADVMVTDVEPDSRLAGFEILPDS
jgi:acylphosphatase